MFSFLLILVIRPTNLHAQKQRDYSIGQECKSPRGIRSNRKQDNLPLYVSGRKPDKRKKNLTITASQMPVETFLNKVLSPMSLTFKRSGNTFAIIPIRQEKDKKLTGVVVDENNEPLIGVSIQVKGVSKGTTTDIDGKFTIDVNPSSALVFSYLGYLTQEQKIKDQQNLKVNMVPDTQTLDEVVVIGSELKEKEI